MLSGRVSGDSIDVERDKLLDCTFTSHVREESRITLGRIWSALNRNCQPGGSHSIGPSSSLVVRVESNRIKVYTVHLG